MQMRNVLVTGAKGFIGKNLCERLRNLGDISILEFDIDDEMDTLESFVQKAGFIFHFAGVNRPRDSGEFVKGNQGFTDTVLGLLEEYQRKASFLITSSSQAALDNPYGTSKRLAEESVFQWARKTGNEALVYRLPNVFGKWCRPNFNSVVATFCHNISHDLPIDIHDPMKQLQLVYIDEVIDEFIRAMNGRPNKAEDGFCYVPRTFQISLQDLADTIRSFKESRDNLMLPDFSDDLTRFLYATYVSYLPRDRFAYRVPIKHDNRGWLAEILKSKPFGQIFVSWTRPGITRGNHWHHTKVEKFVVISGEGVIRFRQIHGNDIIEIPVSGDDLHVVDIPTGYTHSIVNVGESDLITLFWADEVFASDNPDTYFMEV